MNQTNHAMEFSKTMRFINDPTMGMVELFQGGHVLSDAGGIAQAKGCLKDVQLRLEEREDEIRRYKDTGYLENTDGGKQLLARVETFKEWIGIIERAIKEGTVEIEKKAKEKLEKESQQYISMARGELPRLQGDKAIITKVIELAALLKGRSLAEVVTPVLESRKRYRIALRNIERLKAEGVKITETFDEFIDDGLEGAFERFKSIDFTQGNLKRRRFGEIKKAV